MVAAVLLISGITQLIVGTWTFVSPGSFYDVVATYPPENDHFLKDIGSWNVALGAIALYGARRRDWHVPLLGFLALQYVLHTIAHIVDAGDADPASHDVVALVTQGLGAVVLTALFLRERAR